MSENRNSAYVSGHRYGRTDLQTMRRTLRNMKKGECEALAQVFVSVYRVNHGHEISGCLHGKWTSLTLWGFGPVQRVWGHSVGWKKSVVLLLLICFVLFFKLRCPTK